MILRLTSCSLSDMASAWRRSSRESERALYISRAIRWILPMIAFSFLGERLSNAWSARKLWANVLRCSQARLNVRQASLLTLTVPVLVAGSGGGLGRKTGRRSGERLPA